MKAKADYRYALLANKEFDSEDQFDKRITDSFDYSLRTIHFGSSKCDKMSIVNNI